MTDWGGEIQDPFPREVRKILADHKKAGMQFDIAWVRATRQRPQFRGWSRCNGEEEAPIDTLRRAMKAAYYDIPLVNPHAEKEE